MSVVEDVDHCFYIKSDQLDLGFMNDNDYNRDEMSLILDIDDPGVVILFDTFRQMHGDNGTVAYKKDYVKNYLFIISDIEQFIYVSYAYPKSISSGDFDFTAKSVFRCEIVFGMQTTGAFDIEKYPFIKPFIRKLKIQNLIKKKII